MTFISPEDEGWAPPKVIRVVDRYGVPWKVSLNCGGSLVAFDDENVQARGWRREISFDESKTSWTLEAAADFLGRVEFYIPKAYAVEVDDLVPTKEAWDDREAFLQRVAGAGKHVLAMPREQAEKLLDFLETFTP